MVNVGDEVGFDDTIDRKGLISLAEAALADGMRADLPKPPDVGSIFERLKALSEERGALVARQQRLESEAHSKRGEAERVRSEANVGEIDITQGRIRVAFDTLGALYSVLRRVYELGVSLPDAPLKEFEAKVANLPRTTEAERLVVQRIGQDIFRDRLMDYWQARCPLTGISDPALLRASHIIPWAECESDQMRLDVHNGLLLSALWDAAFDAGLVSFGDNGAPIASPRLSQAAATALSLHLDGKLLGLTDAHRTNLAWHRSRYGFT